MLSNNEDLIFLGIINGIALHIDLNIQKLILKGFWVDNICSVSFLGCANVQILVANLGNPIQPSNNF